MVMLKDDNVVLAARGVTKAFGGIKALDDVSLEIYAGKVNAIVGENGAGKSTLMKILSGAYQEYEGQILLNGREVIFANPKEAQEKGIAMIHQELNLIPYLSVAENIFLGSEFLNSFGLIDFKRTHNQAHKLLDKLNLQIDPGTVVCELRVGQQQVVEIAKALSLDANIIIMDEPTSAISERETEVLFGLIKSLTEHGAAIVYITHKLNELFQIADRVTVMRDGKVVGSKPLKQVSHDDVVRMMVGRDIKDFFVKTEAGQSDEAFRVKGLHLAHPDRPGDYLVKDINFSVNKGEVLGLFGLMGAGRTELFETIFGVHPKTSSGQIFLEGQELKITSPRVAIDAGIALVPEDRKLQGLILEMSVGASISLASIEQTERFGFLSNRLETALAKNYIDRLRIRTTSARQVVEALSGGNQQKVVIAKWLATKPMILLLDEPTRGIDVNAKNEIYRLISELAEADLAIIMISSELPEIMTIADRIIVLSEGKQTAEFSRAEASEEAILKAAIPGPNVSG